MGAFEINLLKSGLFPITILFGLISGAIPIDKKYLFSIGNGNGNGNRKKSPIKAIPFYKQSQFYYSVFINLLRITVTVIYLIVVYPKRMAASKLTSELILNNIWINTYFIADFFRREFIFIKAKLIQTIFQELNKVKVAIIAESTSDFNNSNPIYHFEKDVSKWMYLIAILNLFNIIGCMSLGFTLVPICQLFSCETYYWIQIINFIINLLVWIVDAITKFFVLGFVIFIGQDLVKYYQQIVLCEFLQSSGGPGGAINGGKDIRNGNVGGSGEKDLTTAKMNPNPNNSSSSTIFLKIRSLQRCFYLYNKLAGFLIFVILMHSSIYVVYDTYALSLQIGGFMDIPIMKFITICEIFEHLLTLYLVAYNGQLIEDTFEKTKHAVRSELLRLGLVNTKWTFGGQIQLQQELFAANDAKIKLGNYILDWNCKLSVCGMFNVNYSLYPMLAGTAMTYVMFMFQLKISEDTTFTKNIQP